MNFALLWLDGLLISLLWVATCSAVVGRLKRRWVRGLLAVLVLGVPTFFLGIFVFGAAVTKIMTAFEPNLFGYALSLLLAYLVGASLILGKGRRTRAGLMPASASWSIGPLLFALLTSAVVGYMTVLNMDFAVRARCALQSVEVNLVYLATLPAVTSESQNGAPLYEKAFAQLRACQDEETAINNTPTGNSLTFDPNEPATISFLRNQAATLALLRKAAAMSACRFDADLTDSGIQDTLFSLNEERNAANVLNLDAREEIAHGRIQNALIDAQAILWMSRQFGERPKIISGMVGVGIAEVGNRTIELALPAVQSKAELSPLHLDDLLPIERAYQQSLRGEERFGLSLMNSWPDDEMRVIENQIRDPGLLSPLADGAMGALYRVFFLNSEGYVALMQRLQVLCVQPFYLARPQLQQAYGAAQHGGLFASILLPSLNRDVAICATASAQQICTRCGLAATEFRLDHGKLPPRLADLVPNYLDAIPLDPFDGKPLRWSMKRDRLVIYSIGPDLIDRGGIQTTPEKKSDITFILWFDPAKAAQLHD